MFYFYQDMSKDDDVPKKLQNDFLHQMYEDFGCLLYTSFMFGNRALTYVSTEGEPAIKQLEAEQNEQVKKKGRKAEPETVTADSVSYTHLQSIIWQIF